MAAVATTYRIEQEAKENPRAERGAGKHRIRRAGWERTSCTVMPMTLDELDILVIYGGGQPSRAR
jgi:hypothetical protein